MPNKNLKKEFEQLVPKNIINVLEICSQVAEELSIRLFLIGGVVRDIITGKNHFDTDITVQGNAIEFAHHLVKMYPEICKIKEIHESFCTVKVVFTVNKEQIELDIASTRKETYPYPGSLPVVEEIGCDLYYDVNRRDFSINSMAISLNKENYGELIDYLGGYEDIKQKRIRVLHEKSFIDDPTRIIRALKFRVRFGYELDDITRKLQNQCLLSKIFDNFCGKRINSELKQTFNLNKSEVMEIFLRENIYRLVDKDIKPSYCCPELPNCHPGLDLGSADLQIPKQVLNDIEAIISEFSNYINPDFIWLIYLGVLFSDFSKEKISLIVQKLYLSGMETAVLTGAKDLLEKADCVQTNFEIYEFFEGFMSESILICLIKKPELKEKADLYFKKLKDIKIYTTGETLINLGLKPAPVFKEILRKLLKARINGEFSSEEEEKKFLKKILR